MKTFNLNQLVRKNIQALKPYSSARSEFGGEASVFLDANENSMGSALQQPYNRYPDPQQKKLKKIISDIKNVPVDNIFLGNGSDEPIDLLIRATCTPGVDNILCFPPTYGMYDVSAGVNDVVIKTVLLTEDFQIDVDAALAAINAHTKLIFVCSPNNPTGNVINRKDIEILLNNFDGIVVVDEAYIDFATEPSWSQSLEVYPNLVVLQTFSKAWGLAGLRMGLAYASKEIIAVLNKIKAPYNISEATQELCIKALANGQWVEDSIKELLQQKQVLEESLQAFSFVQKIYPTDANFILVRVDDANGLYKCLLQKGIVVRNRSSMPLCENCIRITIGTAEENKTLLQALKEYK